MTRPARPRSEGLEVLRELMSGRDSGVGGTFVRGLTVGALIGAAVAGSAIWQRRRGAHAENGAQAGGTGDTVSSEPGASSEVDPA